MLDIRDILATIFSMSNNSPSPKVYLINFIRLIEKFVPVLDPSLVNENNTHGWTGEYKLKEGSTEAIPSIHQLINHAFAAIGDMKKFITEHETIKANLFELQQDATKVHKLLMGSGLNMPAMFDGVEIILGRFKQALDVIRTFATKDIYTERDLKKLHGFQKASREFLLRFIKDEAIETLLPESSQSGKPSSTKAILESGIKPGGDNREDSNSGN